MQLPDSVKAIRARYVAQYPVPQGQPGEAFEERARQWSIAFAEQVAFEQGPLWGMKRADPNRPISKDTITFYADDDGVLRIWDLLTGTGTGSPRLVENPESEDITGQVFVRVTPTNHLGTVITPIPPPLPPLPPADLGPVLAAMSNLTSQLDTLLGRVDALDSGLNAAGNAIQKLGDLSNALVGQQQALVEAVQHITIPDAEIRLGGRVIGKVDFPGN